MAKQKTEIDIALLNQQMKQNFEDHADIKKSVDENSKLTREGFANINQRFDSFPMTYATKKEVDGVKTDIDGVKNKFWWLATTIFMAMLGLAVYIYEIFLKTLLEKVAN